MALKFVQSGEEVYTIHNQTIPVSAGQFILVRPEVSYQAITSQHAGQVKGCCIDLFPSTSTYQSYQNNPLLFTLPFSLSSNFAKAAIPFSNPSEQGLRELYLALETHHQHLLAFNDRLLKKAKKEETRRALFKSCMTAKSYIDQSFTQKINLKGLSLQAGLSPFQLQRDFKRLFDLSPKQYQEQLRMEHAVKWMATNTSNFEELAFQLGYYDASNFSKAFKGHYGLSPTAYRKQLLNN